MYRVQVGYGYTYDFETWEDAEWFMRTVLDHYIGENLECKVSDMTTHDKKGEEV